MKRRNSIVLTALFFLLLIGSASAGFVSEITEMTFNTEVIESDMPVLVWFYYSKDVSINNPFSDMIDKVALKSIRRVKTLKMDSKFNVITSAKLNIKSSSVFVLFVDGSEKARSTDIRSEKDLNAFIDKNLPQDPSQK
ncbi:MAG: thioredoxin family protein [Vulcanimicrobiota bacterium]